MKTLALDCADQSVSCAVVEDDSIVIEQTARTGFTHSKTLLPMVENVLSLSELTLNDIDRFVITNGPGSFTGLRIGIAAVKGMAFAKKTPCVGVSTLHTIAAGHRMKQGILCAVMDARREQVYYALFQSDGQRLTRLTDDGAATCDRVNRQLETMGSETPVYIVGPGADMFCNRYPEAAWIRPDPAHRCPRAADAAWIAGAYPAVSAEQLFPVYLRLPQAERELKERNQHHE